VDFIERHLSCGPLSAEPSQCGIADHRQEPGSNVSASKTVEEPKGAQVGLLDDVLRILLVPGEPTRQVKSRVQMRKHRFFEEGHSWRGFHQAGPSQRVACELRGRAAIGSRPGPDC
jgi:hypothetical protein